MSMNFKADPGGNKGIVQINGVDKLEINADGSIVALDPVVPGDTTVGRLLQVGDFGLGLLDGIIPTTKITDFEDDIPSGLYYYTGGECLNAPSDTAYHYAVQVNRTKDGTTFIVSRMLNSVDQGSAGELWYGTKYTPTESVAWTRMYAGCNILGTVSQSGGVPTGAIIETGSNANGKYVRFADGTLMCTREITTADLSARSITNANSAGGYRSGESTLTLASPFVVAPVPSINIANNSYGIGIRGQATTNSVSVALWAINSAPSPPTTYGISIVVIGRWF